MARQTTVERQASDATAADARAAEAARVAGRAVGEPELVTTECGPLPADEVPWLTPEQQGHWRAVITGMARLTEALGRQLERDAGLSLSEYEILVRLSESAERTMRMSELAAAVVHSRSRLTHAVGRLENRGLVQRRPCPDDRRGVNCHMTDEGFAVLAAAAPGHVREVRAQLVDQLDDAEFAALGAAMAKVAPDHVEP
jgi:DNA-binding MarR family transcriptional regulator